MTEIHELAAAIGRLEDHVAFSEREYATEDHDDPDWLQCIADIRTLLATVKGLPQWQDIGTAPRDGTDFLGCWGDDELHVVCIRDGKCRRTMDIEPWVMPVKWHPLPASPPPEGGK
jgi:hypothetical protein